MTWRPVLLVVFVVILLLGGWSWVTSRSHTEKPAVDVVRCHWSPEVHFDPRRDTAIWTDPQTTPPAHWSQVISMDVDAPDHDEQLEIAVASQAWARFHHQRFHLLRRMLRDIDVRAPAGPACAEQWARCGRGWQDYEAFLRGQLQQLEDRLAERPRPMLVWREWVVTMDTHLKMSQLAQYVCLQALPAAAALLSTADPRDLRRQLVYDLRPWGNIEAPDVSSADPHERDRLAERQWDRLWEAPVAVAYVLVHLPASPAAGSSSADGGAGGSLVAAAPEQPSPLLSSFVAGPGPGQETLLAADTTLPRLAATATTCPDGFRNGFIQAPPRHSTVVHAHRDGFTTSPVVTGGFTFRGELRCDNGYDIDWGYAFPLCWETCRPGYVPWGAMCWKKV